MTDNADQVPDPAKESVSDQFAIKAIAAHALLNMEPTSVYVAEAFRFASQGAGGKPAQLDKIAGVVTALRAILDGAPADKPQNVEAKTALLEGLDRILDMLTTERDAPTPELSADAFQVEGAVGRA